MVKKMISLQYIGKNDIGRGIGAFVLLVLVDKGAVVEVVEIVSYHILIVTSTNQGKGRAGSLKVADMAACSPGGEQSGPAAVKCLTNSTAAPR